MFTFVIKTYSFCQTKDTHLFCDLEILSTALVMQIKTFFSRSSACKSKPISFTKKHLRPSIYLDLLTKKNPKYCSYAILRHHDIYFPFLVNITSTNVIKMNLYTLLCIIYKTPFCSQKHKKTEYKIQIENEGR